jgi:hypothetical protein
MNKPKFFHCGGCEMLHPLGFTGDCRDDSNRFAADQLDSMYGPEGEGWEEVSERQTVADFIADHNITADAVPTDHNPNMDDSATMDHWRVTLRRPGKKMTVYFSMGSGHNGKAPEAADVLDCLASDASSVDNARDFADWASDYGYDTDSRKAHKTYTVCKRQAERLKKFLGESYDAILFETERL